MQTFSYTDLLLFKSYLFPRCLFTHVASFIIEKNSKNSGTEQITAKINRIFVPTLFKKDEKKYMKRFNLYIKKSQHCHRTLFVVDFFFRYNAMQTEFFVSQQHSQLFCYNKKIKSLAAVGYVILFHSIFIRLPCFLLSLMAAA